MAEADIDTLGDIDFEGRFLMTSPTLLDYTGAKANLANVPDAKFLAKAIAAGLLKADLGNFDLTETLLAIIEGGATRTIAQRAKDRRCVLDYAGATFLQKLQAAVTDAGTTGGEVFVPAGTYAADTGADGPLAITGSNVEIVSARRSAFIAWSGNNTHIAVGGSTTRSDDVSFRGLYMQGAAGQALIQTRYARGVRFHGVKVIADGFLILGDDALDAAHGTYIVELYDGCELNQRASPTRHFVHCRNFVGQWVNYGAFCEGVSAPGIHGFYADDNIQARIDDFHVLLGYWSRFDSNYRAVDARLVNAKMIGHHSEGALSYAVRLEATSGSAKSAANVGCEGVHIIGCQMDAAAESVAVICDRAGAAFQTVNINSLRQTGASGASGAVRLQASAGLIQQATVDGVRGLTSPGDAGKDWIAIVGADGSATIDGVIVDNVGGRSKTGTVLRSQVRVTGAGNLGVKVGGNLGSNAASLLSDTSGTATRAPTGTQTLVTTLSFGSIAAGASANQAVTMSGARSASDLVTGNITGGTLPAAAVVRYAVVSNDTVWVTVQNAGSGGITADSISFTLELRQYH